MGSWVANEIKAINFGDLRLKKRLGNILEAFFSKPMESITSACKAWADTKAAYRFFDHEKVNEEKILNAHRASTIERLRSQPIVLCLQDTTEIDYTSQKCTTGLGPIGHHQIRQGFYLHPTIAVTPERLCLGTLHTKMWARDPQTFRKKGNNSKRKISEKESIRWLESLRETQKIALELPNTLFVNISDREGDIYEMFLENGKENTNKVSNMHFIIRGAQNRCIENDPEKQGDTEVNNIEIEKLWSIAEKTTPLGEIEFEIASGRGREGRHVKQRIYAAEVLLKAPNRIGEKLPATKINVVITKEIDCPGGKEPIEWLLLSDLPIANIEDTVRIIEWYLCRWQIEVFFKILKSGCQIEKLQLESYDRLKICLSVYMIVAWRIFFTTMLGRNCPDMPCDTVFDKSEWKAVYVVIYKAPPPDKPPTLSDMIKLIAGLGGFLGRKGDGFPGVKTMWIGMQRMRDFALAWDAFYSNPEEGSSYG